MSITVQTAVDKGRALIDDAAKTDWSDTDLVAWYNDGVVMLRSVRPDTLLAADGTLITYAAGAVGDDMIFAEPEKWIVALANYIAYKAFSEDAGDKRDSARSTTHWDNFSNNVAML